MIEIMKGNLVEADAEALVNTVNCVGYMGKGIALQFKKAFPENFSSYERACRAKKVRPGKMFVFETASLVNPKYIINFPTKAHWRDKSRYEYIEEGLEAIVKEICRRRIASVAVPPLGCGLGGLDWSVVREMIEKALSDIPDVRVLLFEPVGTPDPKQIPVR
jgi:O-acetyl-ADP-ribose deacetylase (regulator of RNase III)